jgi:hypothetical protein
MHERHPHPLAKGGLRRDFAAVHPRGREAPARLVLHRAHARHPRRAPPLGAAPLVARTDADSAKLITSDVDERDRAFIASKDRTAEGFFRLEAGVETAIARGLAYAPYADLIWCETSHPDLGEARRFAEGIHAKFPGKLLAYNCSPSFNWRRSTRPLSPSRNEGAGCRQGDNVTNDKYSRDA